MKCHGLHNLTPTYPFNCVSCSSLITYPMFYLQCGREVFQNYWTSCLEGTKPFPWKLSAWRILPPLRCSTTQISQLCGAIPNNTPSPSRYILIYMVTAFSEQSLLWHLTHCKIKTCANVWLLPYSNLQREGWYLSISVPTPYPHTWHTIGAVQKIHQCQFGWWFYVGKSVWK